MWPVLHFDINNQIIERTDTFVPVRSSKNYLHAEFEFQTSDWDGKSKTILFRSGDNDPIPILLGETNTCLVPAEVLVGTSFSVSIIAGDLITANVVTIKLYESGYRTGDIPEPSETLYEQLMTAFDETKQTVIDSAKTAESWAHGHTDYPDRQKDNAAYYAEQARNSAKEVPGQVKEGKKQIDDYMNALATTFDSHVNEKISEAEKEINNTKQSAVDAVSDSQKTSVIKIEEETNKQIKSVENAGTAQVSAVNKAGGNQIEAISTAGSTAVDTVKTQQSKVVQSVTDEGTKQIKSIKENGTNYANLIDTSGKERLKSIQDAGQDAVNEVTTQQDAAVQNVSNEGRQQVAVVNSAATTQIDTINAVGSTQKKAVEDTAKTEIEKIQAIAKEFEGDHAHVENLETRVSVVEKQMANINMDEDRLDNILLDVESGLAATKYPVGTQIITDWNRIDASGNKTAYRPELNIVHYGNTAIKDSEEAEERNANVMYLEWDKTIPDGFAFCIQQALQCFDGTEGTPDGLAAGNYSIKMVAKNGGSAFKTKWDGKYANFTLAKDIPSGGIMRLTVSDWNGTSETAIAMHVITNAGINESDAKIEEVIVTESTDSTIEGYTFLGETWGEDVGYGKLNYPESCYYGDNTWATSDLRQWLNAEGADWWAKQTRYNRKPNIATRIQGYLTGLDEELKSHIKFAKHTTIGSNLKYPNQKFVTYDRVFLHSFNQSNITTDYSSQFDNEGERWEYYKKLAEGVDNLNAQKMFKVRNVYPILIRYAINAITTAQYVFSRSAHLGTAYNVRNVLASGGCGGARACSGDRCLPACLIAK